MNAKQQPAPVLGAGFSTSMGLCAAGSRRLLCKQIADTFACSGACFIESVGVDIQRGRYNGMSQVCRYTLDVCARSNLQAGVDVSEIVNAIIGKFVPRTEAAYPLIRRVWVQAFTIPSGKYAACIAPLIAQGETLLCLLNSPLP